MMKRREILKFSLLAPIAGLFKKKEPEGLKVAQLKGLSQTDICNEALTCISETTGTSSQGPSYYLLFDPTSEDVIIKSLGQ